MDYITVICAVIDCLCNVIKTSMKLYEKISGSWTSLKKRSFYDEESLHDHCSFDASRLRHLHESGKEENCLCYQTNTKEEDPGHHTTCTLSANDGKSINKSLENAESKCF